MTAEEILDEEGEGMLRERANTLEWVLDHDDPQLTKEEQSAAESRLEEFREVLERRGSDD
jgi:hypothetical protein